MFLIFLELSLEARITAFVTANPLYWLLFYCCGKTPLLKAIEGRKVVFGLMAPVGESIVVGEARQRAAGAGS